MTIEREQGVGENRSLPLFYRPQEYDDWGCIRFSPDSEGRQWHALKIAMPTYDEDVLNEHRANGTDPCEQFGRRIVSAVNSHAALLEALKGLLAEFVGPYEESYPSAQAARAAIALASSDGKGE